MSKPIETVHVEQVREYTPEIAAGIGALMPQLDAEFSGEPTPQTRLERIISSPDRAQLVALYGGRQVVGAATMNTVAGAGKDFEGWLEDFVVDRNTHRLGVGTALWNGMLDWCRDQNLPGFSFGTETHRTAAIKFYASKGAQVVDGTDTHYTMILPEVLEERMHTKAVAAYTNDPEATSRPLGEGMVNMTELVTYKTGKFVLQKLNPAFNERMAKDSSRISSELCAKGWEVPRVMLSQNNKPYFKDSEAGLWRASTFIESEPVETDKLSLDALLETGKLLGKFHEDLAGIDYEPSFSLPHFHDTAFYARHLTEIIPKLPDNETSQLASELLSVYQSLPVLPESKRQLVHGDPQMSNMLFRDGMPFTFIDLDTVMQGSIWVDIGDMLRSVLQNDLRTGREPNLENIAIIAEGYRSVAAPDTNPQAFLDQAKTAAQIIAVELAIRFMNDIADDNYFSWDSTRFANRKENHLTETARQMSIFTHLEVSWV